MTAGFAEWLERILISRSDESAQFLDRKIRREILLGYKVHDSFRLGQHGLGGAKPNPIEQRVSVEQGFRFLQMVVKGVKHAGGAFADELAIDCFASPDLSAKQFTFTVIPLRHLGGCDGSRSTYKRTEDTGHRSDN
jgi:hypothetical protein